MKQSLFWINQRLSSGKTGPVVCKFKLPIKENRPAGNRVIDRAGSDMRISNRFGSVSEVPKRFSQFCMLTGSEFLSGEAGLDR